MSVSPPCCVLLLMSRLLKWQCNSLWLGFTTCDLVGKVVTSRWLCQGNSPSKDSLLILQRICTGLISRFARNRNPRKHTRYRNGAAAAPRLRGLEGSSQSAQPALRIHSGAALVAYCQSVSTGTSAWAPERRRGKRDEVSWHKTTSGLESRLKACCNLPVGTISARRDLCQLGNHFYMRNLFSGTILVKVCVPASVLSCLFIQHNLVNLTFFFFSIILRALRQV